VLVCVFVVVVVVVVVIVVITWRRAGGRGCGSQERPFHEWHGVAVSRVSERATTGGAPSRLRRPSFITLLLFSLIIYYLLLLYFILI